MICNEEGQGVLRTGLSPSRSYWDLLFAFWCLQQIEKGRMGIEGQHRDYFSFSFSLLVLYIQSSVVLESQYTRYNDGSIQLAFETQGIL